MPVELLSPSFLEDVQEKRNIILMRRPETGFKFIIIDWYVAGKTKATK